uniref:YA3 n=1 Tax=Solanum tuberosum TaxID=4113 RepID=M1A9B3_SOLTU
MGQPFQLTLATRQVPGVLIKGERKDLQFKTCTKDTATVSQLAMAMVHLCILPRALEVSKGMATTVAEVGTCWSIRLLRGQLPAIKKLHSTDGGVSPAFSCAMGPFLASFMQAMLNIHARWHGAMLRQFILGLVTCTI